MEVARYIKIGLFFVSLGAAGTGYMVMSTDGYNRFNTKVYEVVMDDASGLSTNSKVFLSGVPVGKIKSIELDGEEAILEVSFLKEVMIRDGAQVSRRASSILGTSMLVLDPGAENLPVLPVGSRIAPAKGGGDMGALMGTAQDLTIELAAMVRELQQNQMVLLSSTMASVSAISEKLEQRSDEELDRISRILEATATLTERLDRLLASQDTALRGSVADLAIALDNIRLMSEALRSGDGTVSRLMSEDEVYASLLNTVKGAESAVKKLETAVDSVNTLALRADRVVEDAGTIVSQASGLGVAVDASSRYGILAGGVSANASVVLMPAKGDRWYRLGVNDGMTMDLELARRFGILTLRGGLLEGSFGAGLTLEPFSWLAVSSDIMGFTDSAVPDLRARIRLYPFFKPDSEKPWHWLYLDGGMIDILGGSRDFFFGAGLRFVDNEVRSLVGLVPYALR